MQLKKVATEKAPQAIGPYSQAIDCGEIVFTSGQIPINPATGNVEAVTIEEQTEQVMKNLGEVLCGFVEHPGDIIGKKELDEAYNLGFNGL